MGELTSDVDQRWVCPNDRQLALRAKLNSGWSFHSSGPARKTKPGTNISDTEQEVIRNVLNRAERIRHVEEERIGRLVEKLENMRNNAIGDGKETCLLCGSKFGTLKVIGKPCDICNKCVCDKCGVKTCDSEGDDIWLCMLCSEQRELWKRTGAWFFQAIPKYSHPGRADRTDTGSSGSFSDQLSVPQSYSLSRTWTSYSRSRDNLDEDIREKSDSEEEESSSSSDEMSLIDRPKKKSLLSSGRDRSSTSEELSNLFYGTADSASMPGREILENIDTPPPFRKRTLAVSQSDYPAAVPPHQDTNTSHNTSSLPSANGQLLHAANGRHTKAKSPIAPNRTAGSLNGEGGQVDGKTKGLVKKQDTEEEDIDEIVRSFKESEAATPEDGGGAGLGTLDFSVHYEKQHSRLQVTVSCAKGLKAMDSSGTSDPYVKLHLLPGASKKTKLRTHTKYKTLNPKFEETLVYHGITDEDMSKKSLRLQVFDEDKLGRNNFIGETCVALKIFHSKPSQSLKRSLVSKAYSEDGRESPEPDLGRIQLTLKYKSQKGQLVVGVIRCAGLAAMDTNGYSDPYVKCYLKPDVHKKSKRRTSVKKKTLNPEFNEEFTYEIQHHDLAKKSLEVTVWDHDVGKSNDFIGGISMDINAKGSVLKHWYATLKTPNQVHTYWHTLESLANQDQES